jgi:hypothetical protein
MVQDPVVYNGSIVAGDPVGLRLSCSVYADVLIWRPLSSQSTSLDFPPQLSTGSGPGLQIFDINTATEIVKKQHNAPPLRAIDDFYSLDLADLQRGHPTAVRPGSLPPKPQSTHSMCRTRSQGLELTLSFPTESTSDPARPSASFAPACQLRSRTHCRSRSHGPGGRSRASV